MQATQNKISITFFGNVPSKKNNQRIVMRNGKRFIMPSIAYCNWEKAESTRLKATVTERNLKGYQLNLSIYYPNNAVRDEDNTLASVKDCLKVAKITKDDNWQNQRNPPVLDFVGIDHRDPRVEVTITY